MRKLWPFADKTKMGSHAANNEARELLSDLGDDGVLPRAVAHFAYPTDLADPNKRAEMVETLSGRGFAVLDARTGGGLKLLLVSPVAGPLFDALTEELSHWFAARGWEYDGWECEVGPRPLTRH
jgi:hypothetical protein